MSETLTGRLAAKATEIEEIGCSDLELVDLLKEAKARITEFEEIVAKLSRMVDSGYATFCKDGFPHVWKMRLKNGQTEQEHGEEQYSTREAAEAAKEVQDDSSQAG